MQLSIEDHLATLDFNRPETANALDVPAWEALRDAFRTLDADEGVHAVLLKGRGKHFCAGMDVSVLTSLGGRIDPAVGKPVEEQFAGFIGGIQECISAIEACRKPVVAAVQGACVGGGVAIAAACDVRFAAADARFTVKEVDFGIIPDVGTLERLVHLVPLGVAMEWALTGREVEADEALRAGLANAVLPDADTLWEYARIRAASIADKAPAVTAGIKQQLLFAREHGVKESLARVAENSAELMKRTFAEKGA